MACLYTAASDTSCESDEEVDEVLATVDAEGERIERTQDSRRTPRGVGSIRILELPAPCSTTT
jgi:hypothetical protein